MAKNCVFYLTAYTIYATHDCLLFALAGKPDALVLDFFAGSGTTMHATNLLNYEDGGKRKCILVTNNEISETEEKKLDKRGIQRGTSEWEAHGIAKAATWPRVYNSINGINYNGEPLSGNYITNILQKVDVKRNFVLIDYIDNPMELSVSKKKKIVATLCNGKLPQTKVTRDCKFIVSDNEKHTSTILFDDASVDEWIECIAGKNYLKDFIIIAKKKSVIDKVKAGVSEVLETEQEAVPVLLPMAEGFKANVKYFKCDWTERRPEDYLLSDALCLHIKEMIEIQNAIEVDGIRNVLILNKDDMKRTVLDDVARKDIEHIWLNESIILNAEEKKKLKEIGYKYIPREFFSNELKEVAE